MSMTMQRAEAPKSRDNKGMSSPFAQHLGGGNQAPLPPKPKAPKNESQRPHVGAVHIITVAVGVIASGGIMFGLVSLGFLPFPFVLLISAVPLFLGGFIAFGSASGRTILQWLPIMVGGFLGGKRWYMRVPVLTGTATNEAKAPIPPRALDGLQLLDVPVAWARRGRLGGVGILDDRRGQTVTAVLPLLEAGGDLADPAQRRRVIAFWNSVVAETLRERPLAARITWSERVSQPLAPLVIPPADENDQPRIIAPEEVVWPRIASREVVISVSVDVSKVPPSTAVGDDPQQTAVDALLNEVRALARRLTSGGLVVGPPLSPGELARMLRVRCDPSVEVDPQNNRPRYSLAERAGVVTPDDAPPVFQDDHWSFVQIRDAFHRSYWVAEWPYHSQRPGDEPHPIDIVQYETNGTQTVTMVYTAPEPLEPGVEPLAPYPPGFRYLGVVTLSSPSLEHLGEQATVYEQRATSRAMELRPLEGRHDRGWVASLPLGRNLNRD
jgi:hypothetical protein